VRHGDADDAQRDFGDCAAAVSKIASGRSTLEKPMIAAV
jgi:hypothetical protein